MVQYFTPILTPAGTGVSTGAAGLGTAWTNATNARAGDGVFATSALASFAATRNLALTNYGAKVPADAVITGYQFPVTGKTSGLTNIIEVGSYQAAVLGTLSISQALTTINTTYTPGSPTELMGTTPTVAQVMSSTFGMYIRCQNGEIPP